MIRPLCLATILVAFCFPTFASAKDRHVAGLDANGNLDSLIAKHAAANALPEELVRRVIKRESGGNSHIVSKGNYGLMQIKLGTARSLGYQGGAAGLLDPETNMTYAVKYLAGAYRVAGGDSSRAVHYYAAGYYYAAKRHGIAGGAEAQAVAGSQPPTTEVAAAADVALDKAAAKLSAARANGDSVSSGGSLYTAKLDYF